MSLSRDQISSGGHTILDHGSVKKEQKFGTNLMKGFDPLQMLTICVFSKKKVHKYIYIYIYIHNI